MTAQRERLRRQGMWLLWATIAWNVTESIITISLGVAAGSIALVAFGLDSMIEVFASLVVIWHVRDLDDLDNDHRNRRALRLIAGAFVVLGVFLTVTSLQRLISGDRPDESPLGIAYLTLTVLVMFGLAWAKGRVATQLDNDPLAAEARLSFLDGLLAAGVLLALVLTAALDWWWADPAAGLLVALIAFHEGKEHWEESGEAD
jgi:divalent metal cation (Fe/Co/Zn/Cd) transporter